MKNKLNNREIITKIETNSIKTISDQTNHSEVKKTTIKDN